MCGLSLAWVTSENSTMLLESDILRLFFTGPYLVSSPLCSGVWCWLPLRSSTPTSAVRLSPVQLQLLSLGRVVNSRSRPLTTSGYGEIFLSKNPLSGFAPKQTRLLWRPTPIVLQEGVLVSIEQLWKNKNQLCNKITKGVVKLRSS